MRTRQTRLTRELDTVAIMIAFYCRKHHSRDGMCPECAALLTYARKRLNACRFQEGKTTCARCSVHCYNPEMRQRIRAIMRYSGPHMIYRHPILGILHLIDGRRKKPISQFRE